jgi:hypothetical protein
VVKAAQRALEAEEVNLLLLWVRPEDEPEIRTGFDRTLLVRKQSAQAQELADHFFFETLLRVHRASEGAPYTGLKLAGTDLGPAADRAIASGSLAEVEQVLLHAIRDGNPDGGTFLADHAVLAQPHARPSHALAGSRQSVASS